MTREDLLKGNAEIAAQLGKDIKSYCPDLKHLTHYLQPSRYYRLGGVNLFRLETLAGDHFGGVRQHPLAERVGQAFWCEAR